MPVAALKRTRVPVTAPPEVRKFKVVVCGDVRSGKTTFCKHLVQHNNSELSKHMKVVVPEDASASKYNYDPTIGVTLHSLFLDKSRANPTSKRAYISRNPIQLNIWDLGGNANFTDVRSEFYKECQAAFIFVEAGNCSRVSLDEWQREVLSAAGNVPPKICVVINKIDTGGKKDVARDWAMQKGLKFVEISAVQGSNVHEVVDFLLMECG